MPRKVADADVCPTAVCACVDIHSCILPETRHLLTAPAIEPILQSPRNARIAGFPTLIDNVTGAFSLSSNFRGALGV